MGTDGHCSLLFECNIFRCLSKCGTTSVFQSGFVWIKIKNWLRLFRYTKGITCCSVDTTQHRTLIRLLLLIVDSQNKKDTKLHHWKWKVKNGLILLFGSWLSPVLLCLRLGGIQRCLCSGDRYQTWLLNSHNKNGILSVDCSGLINQANLLPPEECKWQFHILLINQ